MPENQEFPPSKLVLQLDADGYFLHTTIADMSPLEPGVYLMPAHALDRQTPPPTVPGKRARWTGSSFVYEDINSQPSLPFAQDQALLIATIDADVDKLYSDVIGNRASEYLEAERQALEYQAAGFTGPVPEYVLGYAETTGILTEAAALSILGQAQQWRLAQQQIRRARLGFKHQARTAGSSEQLQLIREQWMAAIMTMRTALVANGG